MRRVTTARPEGASPLIALPDPEGPAGNGGALSAVPLPQSADTGPIARAANYLEGGVHHYAPDREMAGAIEAASPGTRKRMRDARGFASRACQYAAVRGARGIVIMGAGYPCDPDPHIAALKTVLGVTAVLADPDPEVTAVNAATLTGPQVSALRAVARDPAALMKTDEVQALAGGPLCVFLRLVLSFWDAEPAAAIIAGYAAVLPPGSFLGMSVGVPDPAKAAALNRLLGMPLHAHTAADVTGWIRDAGLRMVPPGAASVRAWPRRVEAVGRGTRRGPRIIGALARLPR